MQERIVEMISRKTKSNLARRKARAKDLVFHGDLQVEVTYSTLLVTASHFPFDWHT